MKIYHYTNLESLALILKNKTIRFNRLDKVDDIEEGNAESLGVKFGKYVFVSCWTENSTESIPLWKMYSGDFGGVRISMELNMYQEYSVSDLGGLKSQGNIKIKIDPKDMKSPDFFILPMLDYNNDLFYRSVKYVDDVFQYTKDAIQITNFKDNRGDYIMDIKSFGYYKNKRWEFQEETRFVLYVFPFNPLIEVANPEISTIASQNFFNNKPLSFSHYDMHLKDDAIRNIEITLSPSATDAQRNNSTNLLLIKYAPQANINDSTLGKLVRLK